MLELTLSNIRKEVLVSFLQPKVQFQSTGKSLLPAAHFIFHAFLEKKRTLPLSLG